MIFGHFPDFPDFHDFHQNLLAQNEKPMNDIKNWASRGFSNWKALLVSMRKFTIWPDAVKLLNFEKSQILVKIHDFRQFFRCS